MRFSTAFSASLLSVALPLTTYAAPFEFNITASAVDVEKSAFTGARITWYDVSVGITACGGSYSDSDHVVALNSQQFGSGYPGPNCGRNIAIMVNGKTVNAKIADNCPGCPYAGLDVTSGLFQEWASLGVGVLSGSWDFI